MFWRGIGKEYKSNKLFTICLKLRALVLKQFFLRAVHCLTALYLPDGRVSKVMSASSASAVASLHAL